MTCKDCAYAVQPTTTMRCRNHGIFMGDNAVVCNDFKGKPLTHYDCIVSKTPEELAKFISDVQERATVRVMNIVSKLGVAIDIEPESVDANARGWCEWLKQEANE